MSLEERTGTRDLTYSGWHRPSSLIRYMSRVEADGLSYIDIDGVEWCSRCGAVLALMETAAGLHQRGKATTVLRRLANDASVPAYIVLYDRDEAGDICRFAARRVAPGFSDWRELTPAEWANHLLQLHRSCGCRSAVAA